MNDQDFDKLLHQVLRAPTPAADLQQRLLALANDDALEASPTLTVATRPPVAANDSLWRRALPVAACLALFLGLANYFQPTSAADLQKEILAHVYGEGQFLESSEHVSLTDVNTRMGEVIGAHLALSPTTEAIDIHWSKDCLVDNEAAMHLIISGETGPVSLMIVPTQVVQAETPINDDRFTGFITPVDGGTLVVLGNRQEPVRKYLNLIDKNLNWEY
jgi:hypothetical protein